MADAKKKAAKISAPRKEQEWRGEYDFAEDGGAVGSFPLRGGGKLPEGAVVFGGYLDVEEPASSDVNKYHLQPGSLSVKLGGKDLFGPLSGLPSWTVGRKALSIGGDALVLASEDEPQVTVIGDPFREGKFQLVLQYWEPSKKAIGEIKARKELATAALKRSKDQAKVEAKAAKAAKAKAAK